MKLVSVFLVSLALLSLVDSRGGSLYDVLGVSRRASQREIRSAYKRQAKRWHPDKNKSPEAKERITEINKAYEVCAVCVCCVYGCLTEVRIRCVVYTRVLYRAPFTIIYVCALTVKIGVSF